MMIVATMIKQNLRIRCWLSNTTNKPSRRDASDNRPDIIFKNSLSAVTDTHPNTAIITVNENTLRILEFSIVIQKM